MSHDRVVKTVRLTVITDFVCVSCCIGQHELLDAIKHCKDTLNLPLQFEMEHIPFRLISPTLLPDDIQTKEDREAFLSKVLGKERFAALQSNVSKYAEEKDRRITLHGIMSPTTKAHRLVLKAGRLGGQKLQTPLISAIFAASMEQGKDIADPEVLADIASEKGVLTWDETLAFLESDELKKEVEEMSAAARAKGITGVPIIIIDGKWAVNGGQSSEVYVQIFKKLATCQGPHCATTSPLPSNLIDTVV